MQPDGSVLVEHLEIRGDANGLQVNSAQPLKVTFMPARTRMADVVNRGRRYATPTSHGGRPINPDDLPGVAEIALNYYSDVLSRADAFFVK